jgi:hypothetical protein
MDPRRPKFQSFQNQTKLDTSRRVCRADSDNISFPKIDTVCESYCVLNFFQNMQKVKGQSQLVKGRTTDVANDVSSAS